MPNWTLTVAQEKLQIWLDAETAIAKAQSYTINTGGTQRILTKAALPEVRKQIAFWDQQITRLTSGRSGPQIRLGVPMP